MQRRLWTPVCAATKVALFVVTTLWCSGVWAASFAGGAPIALFEDAGAHELAGWATDIAVAEEAGDGDLWKSPVDTDQDALIGRGRRGVAR